MNTLVDMTSGMEVKEDDDDFMNAVDDMFAGLEKYKPGDILQVEHHWNIRLDNQYAEFLKCADGWQEFFTSVSLLGTFELISSLQYNIDDLDGFSKERI